MDAKVFEAIVALLNNALTIQVALTAVVSLLAAGFGAYMGGYLRKKAERRAAKEDFREILREQVETTFQTESVKSAIGNAATRSLEHLKTDLQDQLSLVMFRRERLTKLQDIAFEGTLTLTTLYENCWSVPWLTKTSLDEVHERAHNAISRITYALDGMRAMGVTCKESDDAGLPGWKFRMMFGKLALYKDQIMAGNVDADGQANEVAKKAEKDISQALGEWGTHLSALRRDVMSTSMTVDQSSLPSKPSSQVRTDAPQG